MNALLSNRRPPEVLRCIGWIISILFLTNAAVAQSLRYQPKADQKFTYRFKITVDRDDETVTYKGLTHYDVESVNDQQLRLTYRGGLTESKQFKKRRFGGMGPGGFGIPSIPNSPFSRPAFAGKIQTTNEITLTTTGEVLAMKGASQLPYLLGNVSLLPFEPLPDSDQETWTVESGAAISQKNDSNRFGSRFGPFGDLGREPQSIQAANEWTTYKTTESSDEIVSIEKTVRLETPETDNNQTFSINGQGTWSWNRSDRMPQSSDMKLKLTIVSGNTSVTVPVELAFDRVSREEIAKIEADAKRIEEERKLAKVKAQEEAERPLTANEVATAIADLRSPSSSVIQSRLNELAKKRPANPDAEIVAVVRSHLDHADSKVAQAADAAMIQWSPEYKVVADLKRAYGRPGTVKSTGREVNSLTPLYVGQLVQFQEHGSFWFPGEVVALKPDGSVVVRRAGASRREISLTRRNIQLAPEELPQPNAPAGGAGIQSQPRTWSDLTGTFQVQATLLRVENGAAVLKRSDGKQISVPFLKLSLADQKHLAELARKAKQPVNPFE